MEILFLVVLGSLVLGPKQLYDVVRQVALAKKRFETAAEHFRSQIAAEISADHHEPQSEASTDNLAGRGNNALLPSEMRATKSPTSRAEVELS